MLSCFCTPIPGFITRGDAPGRVKIESTQVLKVDSAVTTSPANGASAMLETENDKLGPAGMEHSGPAVLIPRRDSPRRKAFCIAWLRVVLWRWKISAGARAADASTSPATVPTAAPAAKLPPNYTIATGTPAATAIVRTPAAQQPSGDRVLDVESLHVAAPPSGPALRERSPAPAAALRDQLESATTDPVLGADCVVVNCSSMHRISRHSSVRSSAQTHGSASAAPCNNNGSRQMVTESQVALDSARAVRPVAESTTGLNSTQQHAAESNDRVEQRDIRVRDGGGTLGSGAGDDATAHGPNNLDTDLHLSGPTWPGSAIPTIHSRRGALLQAARALQQQTSGRRMHSARYCNRTSTATAAVEVSVAEPGGGEWPQIKAPMAARSGGSLRIFHMTQCESGRGGVEGGSGGGAPRSPLPLSAGVGASRKNTPLVLRRLRITCTSGGSFEQMDIQNTGNGASRVLGAAAPGVGGVSTSVASPEKHNRQVQTSDAINPPLHFVNKMAPFETSPAFLKTQMASIDKFPSKAQKAPTGPAGVQRPGRHARFAGADSGSVASPCTTAPALLARQQTPCPLRWTSALAGWEDSGDMLNEAGGSCWGMAIPHRDLVAEAIDEVILTKEFRQTAARLVSAKEQEHEGQEEVEEDNLMDPLLSATSVARASSRECSCSRPGQLQLHVSGLGQQGQPGYGHLGSLAAALHQRALRVPMSLTKLRRPSISSMVSLVGLDGEWSPATAITSTGTPGASFTIALRTSIGAVHGFGGGAMTPTRRGRRRNLAGNENMSWDLGAPRFQMQSPLMVATTMESGSSSGVPFLSAVRPGLHDHAAILDIPDEALRLAA